MPQSICKFQSTLSVRRATQQTRHFQPEFHISIHALREESDWLDSPDAMAAFISIHALREESDADLQSLWRHLGISIHALREESDVQELSLASHPLKFQSTLSVRRATLFSSVPGFSRLISIHALREESDFQHDVAFGTAYVISIHALREESDQLFRHRQQHYGNFNPRSP